MTRLRTCWVVPSLGVRGRAQQVLQPITDLQHEEHVDPLEPDRALPREEVPHHHHRRLRA
jgi:hypothetical protein